MRALAFLLMLPLIAACQSAWPATTATAPPGSATPNAPPPTPTSARTFPLDEALVTSHETACQLENDKVLYGDPGGGRPATPPPSERSPLPSGWHTMIDQLPRVVVSQTNGIPLHVWADDERWVVCFRSGDHVELTDGEFSTRGQGLVVPLGGVTYGGSTSVDVRFGQADPAVAWVAATIPGVGLIDAPVVDGWFALAWITDPSTDSSSIEYVPYDFCGNQLDEADFGDEETACRSH